MPTHTHRFHSTAVFWRNDLISTVASWIILVKWVVIVIDNFCINLLSHRLRFSWVWLRYLQILDTGPAWKKLKPFGILKLKKKTRQIRFIFGVSMKNVCAHCSTVLIWSDEKWSHEQTIVQHKYVWQNITQHEFIPATAFRASIEWAWVWFDERFPTDARAASERYLMWLYLMWSSIFWFTVAVQSRIWCWCFANKFQQQAREKCLWAKSVFLLRFDDHVCKKNTEN